VSIIEAATLAPSFCNDALWADTCYDTGVPNRYAFDIDAAPSPVDADSLWVIKQSMLDDSPNPNVYDGPWFTNWPAACGVPVAFSINPSEREFRLYNIDTNGVVRTSNVVVGEPDPPRQGPYVETQDRRDLGCNLSASRRPSSPSRAWLGVCSALALALRRARATVSSMP
jgi:hypothetical protein